MTIYSNTSRKRKKITIFLETPFLGTRAVDVLKEIDKIIGEKLGTGGNVLYKLHAPLSYDVPCAMIIPVEYFIEYYQENNSYTEMRLRFPELNYFIPSKNRATISDEEITFSKIKNSLYSFEIEYCDTKVFVSFDIKTETHPNNSKITTETISEVSLKFDETNDLEYLTNLYFSARTFFAFICNRKNIGLRNVNAHRAMLR